jgi:hypothetical protein
MYNAIPEAVPFKSHKTPSGFDIFRGRFDEVCDKVRVRMDLLRECALPTAVNGTFCE